MGAWFLPPGDDTAYACSVARVRVLETRLLDGARTARMADVADLAELGSLLGEGPYLRAISGSRDLASVDAALDGELGAAYALVRRICPRAEVLRLWSARFEAHNVKALLKATLGGAARPAKFRVLGEEEWGPVARAIAQGKTAGLPPPYPDVVGLATSEFKRTGLAESIEFAVDRGFGSWLLDRAVATRSRLLREFFTAWADSVNLRLVLRTIVFRGDPAVSLQGLIPAGSFGRDVLTGLAGAGIEEFGSFLGRSPYALLADFGREATGAAALARFERLADNLLLRCARGARFVHFGPEPLIFYLFGKETETGNVRTAIVGKMNGMPAGLIKERFRDTYV